MASEEGRESSHVSQQVRFYFCFYFVLCVARVDDSYMHMSMASSNETKRHSSSPLYASPASTGQRSGVRMACRFAQDGMTLVDTQTPLGRRCHPHTVAATACCRLRSEPRPQAVGIERRLKAGSQSLQKLKKAAVTAVVVTVHNLFDPSARACVSGDASVDAEAWTR